MKPSHHVSSISNRVSAVAPRTRVAVLTACITATAVLIVVLIPGMGETDAGHALRIVALVGAFAVSEKLIFHIEARREAVSYTPTEIGVAIGLLFVFPLELVLARFVGALGGLLLWRRPPLFKLLFNLAHFSLETLVAVIVFRALGGMGAGVLATWFALLIGLMVALVTGGVLVAFAISQFEGDVATRVWREVMTSPFFHLPTALLAAMIAVSMAVDPRLGLVAFTPAPVIWFMIRSHGALMHRHRDLASVHDFSRVVNDAIDVREIAAAAADRLASLGRASRVTVRLWGPDGSSIDACIGEPIAADCMPETTADPRWTAVFTSRTPLRILTTDDETPHASALQTAGIEHCLIAPISDFRGQLGVVLLCDRQGASEVFDDDDVERLAAMAQQLAIVVRKAHFHAQIQYEAAHDRLTSLPNRGYFEAWTAEAIGMTQRQAVLLIDLDRFKEINDVFGHQAGDAVLVETAERIRSACRPGDLASRFGGDEFAVLATDVGPAEAALLAEVISAALEEPYQIVGAVVAIGASIGIAIAPDHTTQVEGLLRRADLAMYAAKNRRLRAVVYTDDLEESDSTRLTLLADLRVALKQELIELNYQPQLDLATGRIVGAEALARWTHPEYGAISPDVFIGLAEQSGLIEELTRQVLARATAAAAQWHRRGWDIGVSVNVSAQSLLDERLVAMVETALGESGLVASGLMLEITETTMMGDAQSTHRILDRLAELGIGLSVDDFGTGFSSLANLRHFPLTELKIDRKFIIDLSRDLNDDVIVRSTIELGHNLGLKVVAEGVEDRDVELHLSSLGCDLAQGYGISRPIPHQAFVHWVHDHLEAFERQRGGESLAPSRAPSPPCRTPEPVADV